MYKCPNCKERTIPFFKKFFTGPLLHYHCVNCNASLSSSYTIVYILAVNTVIQMIVTICFYESLRLRSATALFLVAMALYYWIFRSPIVIINNSGDNSNHMD